MPEGRQNHPGRLYERVANSIRESLSERHYAIGDRLSSERDLAVQFGVSRSTIREAIIALELDGLLDVRTNSGVYVRAYQSEGAPTESDVGPFELLEARRIFESEVCSLAASIITDEQLDQMQFLIDQMSTAGLTIEELEPIDRAFHMAIAEATRNSAMVKTVAMLWDERDNSAQYRALATKAREAGLAPRASEHAIILNALRNRDQVAARKAMWSHLTEVIDSILAATEVDEIARVRAEVAARRQRFAVAER